MTLLLAFVLACRSVPEPLVAGPMTVKEAKALHAPPGVVVETEKVNPFRHAPPHLISIAFYIAGTTQLQTAVTIDRDGERWWNGLYATGGRLRMATLREEDRWVLVTVPALDALDRRLAFATHAAPDVDGAPGEWAPLPTDREVVAAYVAALGEADRSSRRGDLIREAVAVFPEAGTATLAWLSESGTDADFADVLTYRNPPIHERILKRFPEIPKLHPGLQGVLEQTAADPPGLLSAAAVLCWEQPQEPSAQRVVEGACGDQDGWIQAVQGVDRCRVEYKLRPWVSSCEPGAVKGLLSVMTHVEDAVSADIQAALTADPEIVALMVRNLDLEREVQMAALVAVLESGEELDPALVRAIRSGGDPALVGLLPVDPDADETPSD